MRQGWAGKKVLIAVVLMAVVLLPSLSFSSNFLLSTACSNIGGYYKVRVLVAPQSPYPTVFLNTTYETRSVGLVQRADIFDIVSVCDASLGLRVMVSSSNSFSASISGVPVAVGDPTSSQTALYGVGMFAGLIVVIFLKSLLG